MPNNENSLAELAGALHAKDHAVLVAVSHDSDATCIVERNDLALCFRALCSRVLDQHYDDAGFDHVKAVKRFDQVISEVIREWEEDKR